MFPLAGKTFPTNSEELTAAIRDALADVLTLPNADAAVSVDAPQFPKVKKLRVNLDKAQVSFTDPPPKPQPTGKRQPGIRVDRLEVSGKPIRYEASQIQLDLGATDVTFAYAKDRKGHPILLLTDAGEGHVEARVSKASIESLALSAAGLAARQHGVTIQSVDVDLHTLGKRSVGADIRVRARKLLASGVIHFTGQLDVDEELNATVSDLACTGEGLVGGIVAAMIQPHVKRYDGYTVPLMTFSLGDATLRDLKINVKNGLHIAANFG